MRRDDVHLPFGPAAPDHPAPPRSGPAQGGAGSGIPGMAPAHPPPGPRHGSPTDFPRPENNRRTPAGPSPPQRHRTIRRLRRNLGQPRSPAARTAQRRLSVGRHEPPRPHLLPGGHVPHPGLPGRKHGGPQLRTGLPRTGRTCRTTRHLQHELRIGQQVKSEK